MVMPNNVKIFPRGYSGGQSRFNFNYTQRGGEEEVSQLWTEYTAPENKSQTWAFRRRVILAAKKLLSSNSNWFVAQDNNPYVDDYNYQFVIDTLRFIGTGYRRINIHSWQILVSNSPSKGLTAITERHEVAILFKELKLSLSIDALIQLWCQKPNGFDDLMISLNILFGDIQIRNEKPIQQ